MRTPPISFSRAVFSAVAVLLLAACASNTPKPVTKAPALFALPAKATFAWVRPSELLADATTDDDESTGLGVVRSMKLDVEVLLLGQGWSMVPADSAQFIATVAILSRSTPQAVTRTVQTNLPVTPRCDLTRSGSCPATAPRQATVQETVWVREQFATLAIRRRADGARTQWRSPDVGKTKAGGYFVKELIGLLKVKARN